MARGMGGGPVGGAKQAGPGAGRAGSREAADRAGAEGRGDWGLYFGVENERIYC